MNKELAWILNAIEAAGETAMKDGVYWRGTYTEQDAAVVKLLSRYMEDGGLKVSSDAAGNLFGTIAGTEGGVIMSGSHRDTVRLGGKYDGMLGIVTAICAASSLYQELGKPVRTLRIVAMCEEESSRFTTSNYIGSSHICGLVTKDMLQVADDNGITMETAMRDAGYLQEPLRRECEDISHFVELHIEQGGLLEAAEKQTGIVTSIVGLCCGEVTFTGQQNHAGTTPMYLRQDPMPVCADFISKLMAWAEKYQDDMVCTVGKITAEPGNANVIAEKITCTFDIRSENPQRLAEAKDILLHLTETLRGTVDAALEIACQEPPVQLDADGVQRLTQLAESRGISYRKMPSGAGHDSQVIARHVKTNMIFVPSVSGISHNPKEYTRPADIEAGYLLLKDYLRALAWN